MKGREIWGALVPYGQVWRLGANDATTLEVSEPFKLAGHDLPAGSYALFAIPAKDKWSIVVNSQAKQWGAYFRDPKKDLFSFDVTPVRRAARRSGWNSGMHPESARVVRVEMAWEKLRVSFPVEVDVNGIVWKNLDAARAAAGPKDYIDFYQSARFARESGERKAEAMGWLDEAMKRGDSFWMDELKGDLLADAGQYAEAAPHLEKAIEASKKAGAPEEWRDGARKKLAEWAAKGKAEGLMDVVLAEKYGFCAGVRVADKLVRLAAARARSRRDLRPGRPQRERRDRDGRSRVPDRARPRGRARPRRPDRVLGARRRAFRARGGRLARPRGDRHDVQVRDGHPQGDRPVARRRAPSSRSSARRTTARSSGYTKDLDPARYARVLPARRGDGLRLVARPARQDHVPDDDQFRVLRARTSRRSAAASPTRGSRTRSATRRRRIRTRSVSSATTRRSTRSS